MAADRAPMIWRFTDGKPGHENQSAALAEALEAMAPFEIKSIPIADFRWRALLDSLDEAERPALVMGAGHGTHGAILAVARRFGCLSVVLMKPTLPAAFFDLCLIPRHDLGGDRPPADNILPTRGMLNRIPADLPPKEDTGLILVGGPSKHFGWDEDILCAAIEKITGGGNGLAWQLTDSRRTPAEFLAALPGTGFTLFSHRDTGPDWLPATLATAREVWVTEDSMSMIYEALTARCGVGLLPVPVRNPRSRLVRGVQQLRETGWVTAYADWDGGPLPAPPEPLHEASRCATEVVTRFFPSLS
ncbi:MAG: hypothetical protein HKO57_11550 [Akkermansiaceae bacterium]|nr:hypothetical protein [Akkermansiaceae bacterium]